MVIHEINNKSQLESVLYYNLESYVRILRKWEAIETTTFSNISQLAIIIESQEEYGR